MTDRHQQKPYPLRMPDDLREKLEAAARDGSRSLHAEILFRLESSITTGVRGTMAAVEGSGDQAQELAALVKSLMGQQAMTAAEVKRLADAMERGEITAVPTGQTVRVRKWKKPAE